MTRKPARLERAGALTPRDRMWAAIRELSGSREPGMFRVFSIAEVHFVVNLKGEPVSIDAVDSYFRGLAAARPPYLETVGPEPYIGRKRTELWVWKLVRDVGVDAPRVTKDGKPVTQGLGNELLWQAMKPLKEFDYAELVAAVAERAVAAGIRVSAETAKSYCIWLARAGYLSIAQVNNGTHSKIRYRFVRSADTGPRAPLVTKRKEVLDGNTGELKWKGEKACQDRT